MDNPRSLMERPLIIGQAPARGNDGKPPFAGESGARLARLAGVGSNGDVLPEYFDLLNLMDYYPGRKSVGKGDHFYLLEAKEAAKTLIHGLAEPEQAGRKILLMGRNVERAVLGRKGRLRYFEWKRWIDGKHLVTVFPHPSGISHFWNDSDNVHEAEEFMKKVVADARQN